MDLRLIPLATGLWIGSCLGLVIGSTKPSALIFLALFVTIAVTAVLFQLREFKYWDQVSIRFLILGCVCGIALATLRLLPLGAKPLSQATKQHAVVQVTGVTIDDVRRSQVINSLDLGTRDFGTFKFRTSQVNFRGDTYKLRVPIQVFISGDQLEKFLKLPPETKLQISGKLTDSQKIRGVAAKLTATEEIKIINPPPNYQFLAASFRNKLHQTLVGFAPKPAGLVPGLALGDNSQLDQQLAKQMKSSGLTHLTAVSGSNVTLLIAIVLTIGRRFQIPNKYNYVFAIACLLAFVVLVRPQPSVVRATVMGLVMVFALISKSPRSAIPALAGSVIILLFIDPWLAISFGFALSVFATAGLLFFANALLANFDRHLPKQLPQWLVLGLVVTISAQVAVFPIMIGMNSQISLASLPANLISVPLAGPVMIFGLLTVLVLPISHFLALIFANFAIGCAQGIVFCAEIFSRQKWMLIPWPNGFVGIALALLTIYFAVKSKLLWFKLCADQKELIFTCWLVFAFLIWNRPFQAIFNWVPANWQVASCDVGQGDATVVNLTNHQAIVIDVGGDPVLIDQCLVDLKVNSIPLLLLTHFHADHVVGLPGAIAHRKIGQIRISPLAEPPLTTKFVNQVMQENNLRPTVLTYPEYLKIGQVELFCIWPKMKINETSNTPNNASVSLLIKIDQLMLLLPGDIEPIAQDAIVQQSANLKVAVIKVPHHGSRYQSANFAKATSAKLAIISVGKNNDYGHPAKSTIALYENLGAKIIRTDQHGSIALWQTGDQIKFKTQK